MDSPVDLNNIVESNIYISKLGSALDTNNCIVKRQIFQLLSTLCAYSEDGHKRTLETLDFYKKLNNDPHRFTIVINELEITTDVEYKVALIEFINALITTTTNLQDRIQMRSELIGMKLLSIFHKFRESEHIDVNIIVQMDAFEEQRECDEAQQQQNLCGINLNSHLDLFYAILRQIAETSHETTFLGILQNLLRIDPKDPISDVIWNTIEKLVHRAMLMENEIDSIRLLRTSIASNFTCCHCRKEFNNSSRKQTATMNSTLQSTSAQNDNNKMFAAIYSSPPPPPPPEVSSLNMTTVVPPPPPPMVLAPSRPREDVNREDLKTEPYQNAQKLTLPSKAATPEPKSTDVRLPQQDTPAPKTKMRTINWGKIPPNKVIGKENIWTIVANNHQHNPITDIDWNEMEGLFCIQPIDAQSLVKSTQSKSKSDCTSIYYNLEGKSKKENLEITLLDGKRSLNINIYLKQFKGYNAHEDIIRFVCKGDHEAFGAERLRGLLNILPEIEESEMLKSFHGDCQRLAKAEKFLIQLMEIPNYKLRIESMLLKEEFSTNISYLKPCINSMIFAGDALMSSSHLREVLYMVLVAGNFINSGGYAGNAAGIKLSSLQKLTDIRANKPGVNLIHFVANQAEKRNPILLNFTNELSALDSTSKTSVDQLSHEINALEARIHNIKKQIEQPTIDEDIKNQMLEFLDNSEHEVSDLQNRMKDVEATRLKLAEFFCEDFKSFKLEECYKIFQTFCEKFCQAVKENQHRQLLENQANLRKKQREELLAQRAQYVFDNESAYNLNANSGDLSITPAAFSKSVDADITPNGSIRKRRNRMLAEENDLMEFLRKSGQMQNNTQEYKAAYGSLDRSWSRRARFSNSRRKESDNPNITLHTNRERAISSSPMLEQPKAPATTSTANEITTALKKQAKPRIPSEWHQEIRTWLQTNDRNRPIDDYKRKRHIINANNKWTLENDFESERKLDTLPEEKPTPTISNIYTDTSQQIHTNMKTKQNEAMPTINVEKSTIQDAEPAETKHKADNTIYHKCKKSFHNIVSPESTPTLEEGQMQDIPTIANHLPNAGLVLAKERLICDDEDLTKSTNNSNESSIPKARKSAASLKQISTSDSVVDGIITQNKKTPCEKQTSHKPEAKCEWCLHSANGKEIDTDNIEIAPATCRNPCEYTSDLGVTGSTINIRNSEKCNFMVQNTAQHFDRHSSARRTRRFKHTSDNSSSYEDFNSTKGFSEAIPIHHYKVFEDSKIPNKNIENKSKIEKRKVDKNVSVSEPSPASSTIEIHKIGRVDRHVNISQKDVKKAIRNLKSPTQNLKRLWDPPSDAIKDLSQPHELTASNLSVTKTTNNELNDEGFEEAQSFISDSVSHSKESTNSYSNEIKEPHITPVKKIQAKQKTYLPTRSSSKIQKIKSKCAKVDILHSPVTNNILCEKSFLPKRKISIKISSKSKPKETNLTNNSRKTNSMENSLNRSTALRHAFVKSANITAADYSNVERSNSHNSLQSSRSSTNSISANTVKCMPIIVRKQTISQTSSSHKRALSHSLSNAKLELEGHTFLDAVPTSCRSSSGSSIGYNFSITQKISAAASHTKLISVSHRNNAATTAGSVAFKQHNSNITKPKREHNIETLKTNVSNSSYQSSRQTSSRHCKSNVNSPIKTTSYRFMKPTTSSSTKHKYI